MNISRKTLLSLVLVLSFLFVGFFMVNQPLRAGVGETFYENFADDDLAEVVAASLSCNPEDVITQENINSLFNLSIYHDQNILDLTGIETFNKIQNITVLGNKIETLPEAIDQLPLMGLTLSHTNLASLPDSIGNISTLNYVDLQYNKLTSLPATFKNLNNIKTLYLSNNPLTSLPEFGENQDQLYTIEAGDCDLTEVPVSIKNLDGLKYLNLRNNNLTELPEAIGQIVALFSLDLSGNQLTHIPDTISNLSFLRNLYLHNNQLSHLPANIGNLYLEYATFSNNLLEELPASIGNLTALSSLAVDNNKLSVLPDEIKHLTWLTSLDVSNNELVSLPNSMNLMSDLAVLNISGNRQLELPNVLKEIPNLEYLHIGSMGYNEVPEIVKQMNALNGIYLDDNEFTEFPLAINSVDFPQLWTVSLDGNKIKSLNNLTGDVNFSVSVARNQVVDRFPENVYVSDSGSQNVTMDLITILKESSSDPVNFDIFDYLPSILEVYYENNGNSFDGCKWTITKPNGEIVELEGNVTDQFSDLLSSDYGDYNILLKTPEPQVVPTSINEPFNGENPSFLGNSTYSFPINIMGTNGSIDGTVKDKKTLLPITDAVVGLWRDNQPLGEKNVDGLGYYSFTELDAGNYRVTANAPTYIGQEADIPLAQGEHVTYDFLLDKDTKPGTTITDKEKGNIEGTELPSTGEYSLLIGGILMIFSGVFIVRKFLCK